MDMELQFPNLTSTLQLTGCLFGEKPPGWTYPVHHHQLFELLYCSAGEVTLQLKPSTVKLFAGEWLLIRPGVRHQLHNEGDAGYRFFNMHFDVDDREVRRVLAAAPYLRIPADGAVSAALRQPLERLERLIGEKPAAGNGVRSVQLPYEDVLAVQAYVLLLIRELIAFSQEHQRVTGDSDKDEGKDQSGSPEEGVSFYEAEIAHRIEEELIRDAAKGDVSVTGIANRLGISRSQCAKVFTKVYGYSPRQYVSTLKLKEAKELLVRTNWTMEAIAKQLGFGSASHFSRQFRRWTGVPPIRYRPKHSAAPERERGQKRPE